MGPNSIYRTVVSRLRNAGISGFSTHSFRAFFITEAIERGCDIYKVQRAAGHSDPRTTQSYDQARDDIEESASGYVRI
jgi:integrase